MSIPLLETRDESPASVPDLEVLIAPVSIPEFLDCSWGKAPLVVRRRDRGYYGDLLSLADVQEK